MWEAAVKTKIIAIGTKRNKYLLGNTVSGFMELSNFTTGEPVPWQLWRANMGLGILYAYYPSNISALTTLWIETGYNHGSDHITDLDSYSYEFLNYYSNIDMYYLFDHANISSFEYINLSIGFKFNFRDKLLYNIITSMRYYTPPINPGSQRNLKTSWHLGMTAEKLINSHVSIYSGFYIETIIHDFDYQANWYLVPEDEGNLNLLQLEAGVRIQGNQGRSIIPFFQFRSGNGKGLNFPKKYQGVGGGFKILL